jgi:ATP-binding cassette subfamily F protein 3
VGHLEEEVAKLEKKQNDLAALLEAPETYSEPGKAQHLNRELSAVVDLLTTATAAWEKAAAELIELEK